MGVVKNIDYHDVPYEDSQLLAIMNLLLMLILMSTDLNLRRVMVHTVYVMLALEYEFEGMLIAMYQRKLLAGGEYFLIGVDSKPYDPSHPRLYREGST